MTHCSWDETYSKNIFEFFNILSYNRWKTDQQQRQINQFKTKTY